MRIIKTPYIEDSKGSVLYPAEGKSAFGTSNRVGDDLIGEYRGSDASLPAYLGEWPLVKAAYRTNMSPGEFQLRFDADEFDIIDKARSTDKELNQLWSAMMSSPVISVTSPTVISAVAHLVTKLYITQTRADVIMKGLPL